MADEVTRSAAKLATLVAVPLALVAGVIAYVLLSGGTEPAPEAEPSPQPAPAVTEPVTTEARDLTEREQTVCRAVLSQVPDAVRDLPQRPVTEGAEQNAAYGDPALLIECGVPPADYQVTDMVNPFEGVCWHGVEGDDASVWTTLDREVPVRVTVPDTYDGPFQWAAEFSPTIVETVLSAPADEIPPGCR